MFTVADHLQSLWTPSGGGSTFTTPSPPDHGMGTPGSPNLHSLFSSSPLLAASIPGVSAAAAAALHLQSLPPPPPPGPSSQGGQRLISPGSTEQDIYGGQAGSYPPFGSFHQVKKKQKKSLSLEIGRNYLFIPIARNSWHVEIYRNNAKIERKILFLSQNLFCNCQAKV